MRGRIADRVVLKEAGLLPQLRRSPHGGNGGASGRSRAAPVPVRQWVLTLPMAVRYRAGFDPALASAILELFLRTVFGWLRRKARDEGVAAGLAGAVTVI